MRVSALRPVLGLATSAGLVILLLRAVDLNALAASLPALDAMHLVPAVALYFVGVWLRSVRWALLLPARASQSALFRASVIGFAVNNLVPVRVGDFARAFLLVRWCSVPYGTTLASLVSERILDGLSLALLLLLGAFLVPAPAYVLGLGLVATACFGLLTGLMVLAAFRPNALLRIVAAAASPLRRSWATRLERLTLSFSHGLSPLRSWQRWPLLLLLSLLAWAGQFGLFYVLMFMFPLPASPGLALLTGAVSNFVTLIPSSPGFIGTFDAALAKVLVDASQVRLETAAAYAVVVHSVLFLPVIVVGGVLLWLSDVGPGQLLRRPGARDCAPGHPAGFVV